jgi:hypothetical protein
MGSLYPFDLPFDELYPTDHQFQVYSVRGSIGFGVRSLTGFERGTVVARFAGTLTHHVLQHTLQVSSETHIHDPHFVGLLTHSCAPNCMLDMQKLEVLALADIHPGDLVSIDYASTEDRLFRQFPCDCGAPNCRRWITGRRETVNETGRLHLTQFRENRPALVLATAT